LYIAHFAITDIAANKFYYFEKLNRAGPGVAGAASDRLNAWNENWFARDANGRMLLRANTRETELELSLEPSKPPIIHGTNGVSQKAAGAGHASHYYSITRLRTMGSLRIGTESFQVDGESWMDHEFGTNQLAENQVGWDWFGIQLDNGIDVMLYRMRNRDGSLDPYSSGTVVDGKSSHLDVRAFNATPQRKWMSVKTGTAYPVEWTISIPSRNCELQVTPLIDNQELVTTRSTGIAYWEGAVVVSGMWEGRPVNGRGYLELTGYAEKYRPKV
jgi:predicted secreted hydrolase